VAADHGWPVRGVIASVRTNLPRGGRWGANRADHGRRAYPV